VDFCHIDEMKDFRKILKMLVDECPDSLSKLSGNAQVARRAVYDWIDGRFLPTEKKLSALLDAMQTDEETRRKLFELREEARVRNPKRRARKNAADEGNSAKKLKKGIEKLGLKAEIASDLPSQIIFKGYDGRATAAIYLKLPSYEVLFTRACEQRMLHGFSHVYIVVEKVERHRYEALFAHHQIRIVTGEIFMEMIAKKSKASVWGKEHRDPTGRDIR
jgi:hypothetical protein